MNAETHPALVAFDRANPVYRILGHWTEAMAELETAEHLLALRRDAVLNGDDRRAHSLGEAALEVAWRPDGNTTRRGHVLTTSGEQLGGRRPHDADIPF